jgi:hypothetical protein
MHHPALEQIHEGMKVFDAANHEIGRVDWVRLSDEDPETPETEVAGVSEIERAEDHSLIGDLARAFRDDELPDVIRDRMLREGFIRMDAEGLFARDRYVLPDQIAAVSADGVMLNVSKKDLIKRPA